jgi:type I restriction enzyme S subunit
LAGFEYTKFVKYSLEGDLAVIKAENAGRNGFKRTEFSKVKSSTVSNLTRSQLEGGELLMVFVGAGTGNVARVPNDQPYFLGPNIAMIRTLSRDVSTPYVELFLRSPLGNSLALGFAKAVAQPSLSMGTIRMIPVALPPLAEQHRIVAEAERRLSAIEDSEMTVAVNLQRSSRLRDAVLTRVFGVTTN